ncbi:nucleotidyltransferase domain-containing protein [Paenibacillus sp. DMB20]|uniref:nucleotidyltransferase domain-containing protein n=1 Tax=Paenibacillus sp. DMB20 TaxID=1642570 RepID=UPI0006281A38|nr:nucleotidyltransferase domain-containing protein [Paenibacillus sp. DMB20]KKO52942.1 DNA polymerase subunit beta [Paenibacillus sp. DMB20]KKO53578.1 DNA polymerase subunit beta [Paenibacillus sp. DMB20]
MTADEIVKFISKELEGVPGIAGVVLGGSRARGNAGPASDIDIGIYYDESDGFSVGDLSRIAGQFDDEHRENLVSPLGGWGPWVNAGGWLVVQGLHVDLILRDINRVSRVIDDCLSGNVSTHYHAGHPHAFLNVMYMGEVSVCKVLSDPNGKIAALKAKTNPYPSELQKALIGYFRFEASFSSIHADSSASRDDISFVAGCCFRTIACMNQALFAKNKEYCINEKKAAALVNGFSVKPKDYKERVDRIFTLLSTDETQTREGVDLLKELVRETDMLLDQ